MKARTYGMKAYGRWHRFATLAEYSRFLLEWISGTDGSEQDRAFSALAALECGQTEYDSDMLRTTTKGGAS